ncbi:hypothetical protein AGDE_11678 [Angomonas deanei]|uniref:Uncharacterized protein n=1 Tax=Angomonas deanei TaxID=59799 RepID=A0A7G2CH99_9TRYP|nr:hypothetical protein AGDE_11678 [Angomonas deanei]CAD2217582.1 hypothetical protein, conserved [Angomonas deanei]|eukprot:EPY25826.1 hypothetical protein AGDE_11678 [Angomonas deanei]
MNKLLLTTYRKLHKLCVAMDQRVEARAMLLCSPAEVYDHRSCTWRPVKLEKIVDWQDSRIFLDRLIRRLNNGKSYYIPPSSAEEAQRAEKQFVESLDALHAEQAAALIKENIAKKGGSKSVLTPQVMVPDFILPYMSLQKALRLSFEKNAFFTAHINNSMAAVKEMACALHLLTPQPLLPSEELLAGVPQLESVPCPSPMTHVTLFGLSEEMRGNFSARMEKNEIKFSRSEEKAEGEESVPKVGNEVQLLLAHPRLNGFFKCTVMLVVRHTPSESAAFVLNKPLLSNSLEPIDVRSVVTSTATHPLFKKHLAGHTVMLGAL